MTYPDLAPPTNQYTAFLEDEARIGTLAAEDLHYGYEGRRAPLDERGRLILPKPRGPAHAANLARLLAPHHHASPAVCRAAE